MNQIKSIVIIALFIFIAVLFIIKFFLILDLLSQYVKSTHKIIFFCISVILSLRLFMKISSGLSTWFEEKRVYLFVESKVVPCLSSKWGLFLQVIEWQKLDWGSPNWYLFHRKRYLFSVQKVLLDLKMGSLNFKKVRFVQKWPKLVLFS